MAFVSGKGATAERKRWYLLLIQRCQQEQCQPESQRPSPRTGAPGAPPFFHSFC